MRINHTALYVTNLEAAKDFFIRYFNATSNDIYHNPETGLQTYFLTFDNVTRLEIMTRPGLLCNKTNLHQTGYAHIAFSVGNRKEVDRLTEVLKADGYRIISGPRTTGDGYYESCITGPEGILIEITI